MTACPKCNYGMDPAVGCRCKTPSPTWVAVSPDEFRRLMRQHDAVPKPGTYAGSYTPVGFEAAGREIGRRRYDGSGPVYEVDPSLIA